jgi:NAD(P)-dependent dehydrogenase (short-subunit alcohol dehydrogenase family)
MTSPTLGVDSTTDDVLAGVDLSGRTAVVTGATTGIGLETARALAAAGATVVLTARDATKGATARATIAERVPEAERDGRLDVGVLELGSLASVREFAAWCNGRHPALHLLINNAGVMMTPFGRTADGFETQFGTNHLGHFLLTNLLLPSLVAAAPARIVNVSSGGHMGSDIVWDDPNYERREYDKFAAYGQSKTANILFALELDRRLATSGVHAYSVHPGMIPTDLGRHMTRDDFAALKARASRSSGSGGGGGLPPYKTIPAGAATTVWAATAPELDSHGGAYLADCQLAQAATWATDAESAQRLWALSEQLVGL